MPRSPAYTPQLFLARLRAWLERLALKLSCSVVAIFFRARRERGQHLVFFLGCCNTTASFNQSHIAIIFIFIIIVILFYCCIIVSNWCKYFALGQREDDLILLFRLFGLIVEGARLRAAILITIATVVWQEHLIRLATGCLQDCISLWTLIVVQNLLHHVRVILESLRLLTAIA